ncbi:hypothetical protein QBC34DRAFT_422589 [Podospora aff. communis PSN243]|uniref:Extracellular membrane protein CFEM domain-containing protein n=1 Tax=Podospora aff. communis PSN243 TaxID=3040156 RepID=A0AAV9GYW8_9PEZI|nr:hypothetical protein QBC34DRAFT_422589 [Podospora aff. communis PSN243]
MRTRVLWSFTLFSGLPSILGQEGTLPPCAWGCIKPVGQDADCMNLEFICHHDDELQKVLQCIFTSCDAENYEPSIKNITDYCLTVTVTSPIRAGVDKVHDRSFPVQLNVNLGAPAGEGISPAGNNVLGFNQKRPAAETKPDSSPPIEVNINLNYGSGTPDVPLNPAVHVDPLIGDTSPAISNTNVLANLWPGQGNTGAFATSGPLNPFGNGGFPNNGGAGSGPYGPPFSPAGNIGAGNGAVHTIAETTTICLPTRSSPAVMGYDLGGMGGTGGTGGMGSGNGYSWPNGAGFDSGAGAGEAACPLSGDGDGNRNGNGNGKGERPCSSPGNLQGPFVESVLMGTPIFLAIEPTTPPPPPPPRTVITVFAPAPSPPPPPSRIYGPPPTPFARFDANADFIGDAVAATSFLTITVPVWQAEQTPGATSYGDSGSGAPGGYGGAGTSAPLPFMSPSPRDPVPPTQVTESAAERRRPSFLRISLLVAALVFI